MSRAKQVTISARFERTVNTGNYENVKLLGGGEVVVELEEGDDYSKVYEEEQKNLFETARKHLKAQEDQIRSKMKANAERRASQSQ